MSDIVIDIKNLSKLYRLGTISSGTLSRDISSIWAQFRGKEDPNSKLSVPNNLGKLSDNDKVWALKDISLQVKKGEIIGIIGKNGAGKSTLLKILSRITAPTSGVVKIQGRVASLLEVGTGFHRELTGRENIYLNGAILGMTRKEIDYRLEEIIDFSGIERYIETPVKRYSSGMRVRLAFSVAAHLDVDIILVDEVLAVGDASFQKKAVSKMQDVSKGQGRTVLFVSHNMESIKMLCTRAILLQNGKVINNGLTEEVINYYLESSDAELTGSEIRLPDKPEKHYKILGFGILNGEGIKSDFLDRTKPFQIFIDYILRKKSVDLNVHFGVVTSRPENGVSNNTTVLQWSEKHYRKYKYNDEEVSREPGEYRVVVNIPGYILNSGKYLLCANLVYPNSWYEHNKKGVVFEL